MLFRSLSRFTIVFDREGYSPQFFAQMKQERIAVLTDHKFPGELWREQEFRTHEVSLVNGKRVRMELAERGVRLSNDLWVREVRHLSEKGHQSSILCTDYRSDLSRVAVAMFARWCQEIFFKYMRQHYNLDRLVEYGTEVIPETTRVVNRPGANSIARFAAKTVYSAVNWSNSQKSSCLKKSSPNKSKPIS